MSFIIALALVASLLSSEAMATASSCTDLDEISACESARMAYNNANSSNTIRSPFSAQSSNRIDDDGDGYCEGNGNQNRVCCSAVFANGICTATLTVTSSNPLDCDDNNDARYPGAPEVIGDLVDQDCDGYETCYPDTDHDGYGDGTSTSGVVGSDEDCSDLGEAAASMIGDCDDSSAPNVNPARPEIAGNSLDDNCDGSCDCAYDVDNDGAGADDNSYAVGGASGGLCAALCAITSADDCDDSDPRINPYTQWCVDEDNDFDCIVTQVQQCEQPSSNYIPMFADQHVGSDCNDADNRIYSGAPDGCDGINNDCDNAVDEDSATLVWYPDRDEDGEGDQSYTSPVQACEEPAANTIPGVTTYSDNNADCDDNNSAINTSAQEICDSGDVDEDCDGSGDDSSALGQTDWYLDLDEDQHGTGAAIRLCNDPSDSFTSYADNDSDCDDNDAATYWNAAEICDGKNNACEDYSSASMGRISDPYLVQYMRPEEQDIDHDGYIACCDYGLYDISSAGGELVGNDDYSIPEPGVWGRLDLCMYSLDQLVVALNSQTTQNPPITLQDLITQISDGRVSANGSAATMWGGGDCDEAGTQSGSVHPGLLTETCECVGDEVDSDCNGSTSTYLSALDVAGVATLIQANATCSEAFVLDCDGDGEGADPDDYFDTASRGPYSLCDDSDDVAERLILDSLGLDCVGVSLVSSDLATDCDDDDASTGVFMPESCDGEDNNCNEDEDEVVATINQAGEVILSSPVSGTNGACSNYRLDWDEDGQGTDVAELTLCLCQAEDSGNCESDVPAIEVDFSNLSGFGSIPLEYRGSNLETACYVFDESDCNDHDPDIFKRSPAFERLDGADNDCDGTIPMVELDCDQDGSMAGSAAFGGQINHATLGLADCTNLSNQVMIDCWGDSTQFSCSPYVESEQTGLGLYVLVLSDQFSDYVDNDSNKLIEMPVDTGDCDDQCAARNPQLSEVCDGIDNDCVGLERRASDVNSNGICDAQEQAVAGWVDVCELDIDGDGFLGCQLGRSVGECQAMGVTDRSCADGGLQDGDPDDFCKRSVPGEDDDQICDGILAFDGAELIVDGIDPDRDLHYECGVADLSYSLEESRESVFVLVYGVNVNIAESEDDTGNLDDTAASTADECAGAADGFVPLIAPRLAPATGEVASCDSTLDEELRALVRKVYPDPGVLDEYLYRGPDETGGFDPLLDVCIRAQICAEWRGENGGGWASLPQEAKEFDTGMIAAEEPLGLPDGERAVERPAFCPQFPAGATCTVVEVSINNAADSEITEMLLAGDSAAEDPCIRARLGESCVGDPTAEEQLILRSVWSQERIVESRRRVVEWECFRLRGTYGCGDLDPPEGFQQWRNPFTDANGSYAFRSGGHFVNTLSTTALQNDPRWWKEIGRYGRPSAPDDCFAGCWGNPFPEFNGGLDVADAVSEEVGGDCENGGPEGHRDEREGPSDLLGLWLDETASCDTCLDGLDNNCNGLTDCEDPGCDICFVGRGMGCGGGADSPCAGSSCASAGDETRLSVAGIAAIFAGIGAFALRRRARR